jgi:tRNA A-37 threonylcarbamoyl transferase component Bud32/tetratricopeptide (TPR) repeat protein
VHQKFKDGQEDRANQEDRPDEELRPDEEGRPNTEDRANKEDRANLDKTSLESDAQDESAESSTPVQDKFIGRIIAERYEILDLAGRGGMSSVYRARHVLTDKIIALKLMHSHLIADENAVRRFQQEAKAASRLHHPNAISVQDMGIADDGQPFLTMDYLDGRSLSQEIDRYKQIDPARCNHIFLQVCSALAHAHDQRIVHRDLKPSNVMLIESDNDPDFVKVVDFGIAKILMEGTESLKLTSTGEVFGSPYYMSPEQCMGNPLDARSDIYSMGCLMYEALTGRVPHEGKNVLETMYKHTNLTTPALTDIKADPRVIFRLDQILQKCLAKVPEQRYQSMLELKEDLLELSSGSAPKGSKIAAQLGMGAADKSRQFDNFLAAVSSKKLFWFSVPLLAVLSVIVISFGYYWISTAGDPLPNDRELVLNRSITRPDVETDKPDITKMQNMESAMPVHGEHDLNVQIFQSFLRTSKADPQGFYYKCQRYGFYLVKHGDYERALEAFDKAMEISLKNGFSNRLDNATMKALMCQCLLANGEGYKNDRSRSSTYASSLDPLTLALEAAADFKEGNVSSKPEVTANLGNILELCALRPERLQTGMPYLQELFMSRDDAPAINGTAFAQAAQFTQACAANGITNLQVEVLNQESQMWVLASETTVNLESQCLQKSLDAWQQLDRTRLQRIASYNEGVIYNLMGLLAEKSKDLNLAEANFTLALERLLAIENNRDESVAKVLFNLSEIQLQQGNVAEYMKNHNVAKRIWADTFHLNKKTPNV